MEENKCQVEELEIGLPGEYLVYNTIAHEIETTWAPIDAKPRRLKCEYCGCIADKDYGTCDHCGAPLSETVQEDAYIYMENGKVLSHPPSIEKFTERFPIFYNFGI